MDCKFIGPLGDLTGKSDQLSGKAVHRKGTRQVLDTLEEHPTRKRTNREGHTGVFCLVIRRIRLNSFTVEFFHFFS